MCRDDSGPPKKKKKSCFKASVVAPRLPFGLCEGTRSLLREVGRVEMNSWDHARNGEGAGGTVLGQGSCPLSSGPARTLGTALPIIGPQRFIPAGTRWNTLRWCRDFCGETGRREWVRNGCSAGGREASATQ